MRISDWSSDVCSSDLAYAQKTPINEYKQEAFALFERMLVAIREDVTRVLCNVQFQEAPPAPPPPEFITTHFDPLTGEDNSRDINAGTLELVTTRVPPPPKIGSASCR